MGTIIAWWEGMTVVQQAFACVAVPATVILLLQTVLLLFGLGGGGDTGEFDAPDLPGSDTDIDLADGLELSPDYDIAEMTGSYAGEDAPDMPENPAHDYAAGDAAGVRLFTVRGFVAFFAVGGWLGVALIDGGLHAAFALVLAVLAGFAALVTMGYFMKWSMRLQENGTLRLRDTIAHTGTVYIPIPAARTGTGKVTLTAQSQFLELDAMTDSTQPLPTGASVQVVGIFAGSTLIVRPIGEKS